MRKLSTAWRFVQENKWEALKVLPLGVLLPLIIFFGSVGPSDFARNYAAWAKTFGLFDVAEWLNRYASGPRVFWSTVLIASLYLFVVFLLPFFIRRFKSNISAIVVPICVALLLIVAGYGQYALSLPSQRRMTVDSFDEIVRSFKKADPKLPPFEVTAVSASTDAAGYAGAFMAAFHKGGSTINGVPPDDDDKTLYPSPATVASDEMRGLYIGVKNPKSPPDSAKQLQSLLAEAGYRAQFTNWANIAPGAFVFVVSY